ncbi:hypothetical protein L484_021893 [Morus notabilis]|uniref:Uncharacterized protein n=1 Tax=Morus notabilis TaxID=981085 RepID=W9S423_9ROSA|nr:hypothetical protein L484_021893 [Morus notabilis]
MNHNIPLVRLVENHQPSAAASAKPPRNPLANLSLKSLLISKPFCKASKVLNPTGISPPKS